MNCFFISVFRFSGYVVVTNIAAGCHDAEADARKVGTRPIAFAFLERTFLYPFSISKYCFSIFF